MSHRKYLWSLLTLALLLRVGFGLTQSELTNASDEVHWDRLGQGYVTLGILHPDTGMYRPPLYGLFLAGMYHTFGHNYILVRIAQAIMGTLTCYFIYLLGRRMGEELIGLIATGLFAIYPLFVFFSGIFMAETLLILLTTMSFVSCIQFWQKSTLTMAMAFGGIVGLSALCKPILLPYLPPRPLFLVAKIAPVTCTKSIACTNRSRRTLSDYLTVDSAQSHHLGRICSHLDQFGDQLARGRTPRRTRHLRQSHQLSITLSHPRRLFSGRRGRPPRGEHCIGMDNRATAALPEPEHRQTALFLVPLGSGRTATVQRHCRALLHPIANPGPCRHSYPPPQARRPGTYTPDNLHVTIAHGLLCPHPLSPPH